MSPNFRDLDDIVGITVGTVGEVGKRTFLMQVRVPGETVTVKLEKQQVAALAEMLGDMLSALPRPGHLPDDLALAEPSEPAWVVGTIGLHYDRAADKILLQVEELAGEGGEANSVVRVMCTREQAAALAIHGAELVASGRPPCPICGLPLDPGGHNCPRTNGHAPFAL